VLDYNHEKILCKPPPPATMQTFYEAFLRWRAEAGMDNAVADHLPGMFVTIGLVDILETPQHEMTDRTDPDFVTHISLWAEVAASRGRLMVADGIISETPPPGSRLTFVRWQDPKEHAFSLEVPKQWAVSGGLFRFASVDVRPAIEAVSPDGHVRIVAGDAQPPHSSY
jgi:hypothetical protein